MKINKLIKKISSEIEEELGIINVIDKKVSMPLFDGNYSKYCDHTVLKAYIKREIVKKFCDEAKKYKVASVCVNPIHVSYVRKQLKDTDIKTCIVIGFPLGSNTPFIKSMEAAEAVRNGAEEVDMVLNIGALRDNNIKLVYNDIVGVVNAVYERAKVKVIIETCYLNNEEKIKACVLCKLAGADYVKTSTGFGTGGATVEDIVLIKKVIGNSMLIKASTGINTRKDAEKMIKAGASRLGLSRSPQIIENDETLISATMENKLFK